MDPDAPAQLHGLGTTPEVMRITGFACHAGGDDVRAESDGGGGDGDNDGGGGNDAWGWGSSAGSDSDAGRGSDEVEERDVFLEFDKKLGLRLFEPIPILELRQQCVVLGGIQRKLERVDRAVADHAVAVLDLDRVLAGQPDEPAVAVLEVEARVVRVEAKRRVTAARAAGVGLDMKELDAPAGRSASGAVIARVSAGRTREDCEHGRCCRCCGRCRRGGSAQGLYEP